TGGDTLILDMMYMTVFDQYIIITRRCNIIRSCGDIDTRSAFFLMSVSDQPFYMVDMEVPQINMIDQATVCGLDLYASSVSCLFSIFRYFEIIYFPIVLIL